MCSMLIMLYVIVANGRVIRYPMHKDVVISLTDQAVVDAYIGGLVQPE